VTDCCDGGQSYSQVSFPRCLDGDLPLDTSGTPKVCRLVKEVGDNRTSEQVASGFLAIAVEKNGECYQKYPFSAATMFQVYFVLLWRGGREPCLIADALGMKQVFLHPYAMLSAYGMEFGRCASDSEQAVEATLSEG